ncbi:ABC transporter permease [Paenibacillus mendelii]|nr:ABC transporter permease [Paenibacillus mendelii]
MISSELAELNNLHIGDMLHVTVAISGIKQQLKISGIFSDAIVARSNNNFHAPQFNRRNDVITSYDFFSQIPNEAVRDYKAFLLKDSADLHAFQNELYEKGLSISLYLKKDTDRNDEAVEGINEMLTIVKQFFELIAIIGIGVVFLINVLALRERKYEIGVLRAIGMSKINVLTLLLCEMLILALIGSVLALLTGIFVNPSVVDEMKEVILGGHLPSALMSDIIGIDASLSGLVILEVIVLSILLVFIAGTMTIASITRYDPVKILSERN